MKVRYEVVCVNEGDGCGGTFEVTQSTEYIDPERCIWCGEPKVLIKVIEWVNG